MTETFVQQLAATRNPFLAGFGQYCVDSGLSDAAAYGQLKRAAERFPEVRAEIASFSKEAWVGPALNAAKSMVPKALSFGKSMLGMGAKAAPMAANPAAGTALRAMPQAAPTLGSRIGGAWQGVQNSRLGQGMQAVAKNPMAPAAAGGAFGAYSGYQQGGLPGAAVQGAIGAVGGNRAGYGGALSAPLTSSMFNVGGMAQGATQMGQRFLGMGAPSFNSQINQQASNFGELGGQLEQGIGELNNASNQWKDNSWSGGRYQQAISDQRSKLYGDFRTRAQALGAQPQAVEEALGAHTPRVAAGTDPQQMWQQLRDPETRQVFKANLDQQQNTLLEQLNAGQRPKPADVQNLLMGHAAHTAAEQGIKPDQLFSEAQNTMADIKQRGLTPETAQNVFQGPQGKQFGQFLVDKGNARTPQELMQTAGQWISDPKNATEATMLMMGIPMALWGLSGMMGGNGGMGSLMAMLGGGAMAAYGGGALSHLTGGQYGSANGLMQAFQAPKPGATPASIPLASMPAAGSMAAHYGTQSATPEGAQQSLQSLADYAKTTKTPYDDQIVSKLDPKALPQLAQQYMEDPEAVRAHAWGQVPSYQRPFAGGAFDEGWNSLTEHLNSPAE